MNSEQFQGQLRAMKGSALEIWGRITGDPWQRLAGRRERMMGEFEASLAQSRAMAESSFPRRAR